MTLGVDPPHELEPFFGGLSEAVEAERERRHGRTTVLRQELRDFFGGLDSGAVAEGEVPTLSADSAPPRIRRSVQRTESRRASGGETPGKLEVGLDGDVWASRTDDRRRDGGSEDSGGTGGRGTGPPDRPPVLDFRLGQNPRTGPFANLWRAPQPSRSHSQGDMFLSLLLEELNVATRRKLEEMSAWSRQVLEELHEDSEMTVERLTGALKEVRRGLDKASRAVDLIGAFRPPGGPKSRVQREYWTGEIYIPNEGKLPGVLTSWLTLKGANGLESKTSRALQIRNGRSTDT